VSTGNEDLVLVVKLVEAQLLLEVLVQVVLGVQAETGALAPYAVATLPQVRGRHVQKCRKAPKASSGFSEHFELLGMLEAAVDWSTEMGLLRLALGALLATLVAKVWV